MSAPIIFCHYGNSAYLPYVFRAAKHTNPDKEIVLLGDSTNQWIGKEYGITHIPYKEFEYGPQLEVFNNVFKMIHGKNAVIEKGGNNFLNFVFRRWFYIYNFIISRQIDRFWHFDSDNMILVPLHAQESKFELYDCTEQCGGGCMNGFISSANVVKNYLNSINSQFRNIDVLDIENRFSVRGKSFNEMQAYLHYKEEYFLNTIPLNKNIDGSIFCDCIYISHGIEMETDDTSAFKYPIKRVFCSKDRKFYCKEKNKNEFIRLNSLNLSWVPTEFFETVLYQLVFTEYIEKNTPYSRMETLSQIFLERHPYFRFRRYLFRLKQILRAKLGYRKLSPQEQELKGKKFEKIN